MHPPTPYAPQGQRESQCKPPPLPDLMTTEPMHPQLTAATEELLHWLNLSDAEERRWCDALQEFWGRRPFTAASQAAYARLQAAVLGGDRASVIAAMNDCCAVWARECI